MITEYRTAKSLFYGLLHDCEEEYQIISSAKQKNNKNIEETIIHTQKYRVKQAVLAAPVLKIQLAVLQNTPAGSNSAMQ